jgi:coenzyme F420-reducing hydrogenase beta subunit
MSHIIQSPNGLISQESHPLQEDLFLRLFLSNICLNETCHDCKYNSIPRLADITLGDFWGVKNFHPEMDDNMGTSVVLINNSKGDFLFNRIKSQIIFHKSELNKAIVRNPCILKSYPINMQRGSFFKDLDLLSLKNILEKYKI